MKSRKKDGTNSRDHISNLPDDIISNTLSRLPTKYAVRTCVLSKIWEYKWASIYNIDIYDGNFYERELLDEWSNGEDKLTFINFVDRILSQSQNVRSFSFTSTKQYEKSRMETWLSIVFRRNVENFSIFAPQSPTITLPRSLLNCTSLRTLDIYMPCTWKPPVKNYFPNLTRLCLDEIDFMNENSSTDTLVFHFPVLETFETRSNKWSNVRFVEIYAPALLSFISDSIIGRDEIDAYMIKIIGAGLQKFETHGGYLENFDLIGSTVSSAALRNTVQLDETVAKSGLQIRRLLKEFSKVKSLELTCYLALGLAQTKSGLPLSRFDKLEKLALSSRYIWPPLRNFQGLFEGLLELLHSAPLLKSLAFDIHGFFDEDYDYDTLESVPSCVVSQLEEVKFYHFTCKAPKLRLAMFFLEHGAHLKKLYVHGVGGEKDEVTEQLSKLPKASTCLTIVIM